MTEKKLGKMLLAIVADMIPGRVTITVKRQEGVDEWVCNNIHLEVQKLLGKIRNNEGLVTFVMRRDSDEFMQLEIGICDHASIGAIVRELINTASKISGKYGVDSIDVEVDESIVDEFQAATEVKNAAAVLRTVRLHSITNDGGFA